MNTLILKLGATGDVVRTTPLLKHLAGGVFWVTAAGNVPLLEGLSPTLHGISWERRREFCDREYDLVINLEDTPDVAGFLSELRFKRLFGAYAAGDGLAYTEDARGWFDLSLISRFGKPEADRLKLANRRTYQDLIFSGLGFEFQGEPYLVPAWPRTGLTGDVAIAPKAGRVWPMKNWAYYAELQTALESRGLKVNVLPERPTLLEHLGDVGNHRCLVSGDSLPMHFALATGTRCVTLFTCTGPWEIHPYGIQRQITSPLLAQFFFQRGWDERAVTAITVDEVLAAVLEQLR
jgi:heptosyltransferase-2